MAICLGSLTSVVYRGGQQLQHMFKQKLEKTRYYHKSDVGGWG